MRSRYTDAAYTVSVGVRLSIDEAEQLRQLAKEQDRPMAALARKLIAESLKQIDTAAVPA